MAQLLEISGPSFGPAAGGRVQQLVILLHGYGADGNDLLGLAPHWARLLPNAEFLAPHAPFPCEMSPYGRQWFGFEGRNPGMILGEAQTAAAIVNGFIDAALAERRLTEDRLALVGFSQGTMMALHVAPRRTRPVGAVLGYSGALIAPDLLVDELRSRPKVLLIHGTADPVVPYQSLAAAQAALTAAKIAVRVETRPGLAHAIDEEGLRMGGEFLAAALVPTASVTRP
jgi:phospholipase/carboxylesterase